jgi:DNA-binding cell septation regulator SpoVG
MVKIENKKLIIEINHPCPKEFRDDIKEAIIGAIQNLDYRVVAREESHLINHTLLELMKNLD